MTRGAARGRTLRPRADGACATRASVAAADVGRCARRVATLPLPMRARYASGTSRSRCSRRSPRAATAARAAASRAPSPRRRRAAARRARARRRPRAARRAPRRAGRSPTRAPTRCSTTRNASTRCVSCTCTAAGSTSALRPHSGKSWHATAAPGYLAVSPPITTVSSAIAAPTSAPRLVRSRHPAEPRGRAAQPAGADERRHRRRDDAHRHRPVRERRERRVDELHRHRAEQRRGESERDAAAPPCAARHRARRRPASPRRRHAATNVAISASMSTDAR